MAEQPDSQERTEQPTPKRLADAREKGRVPRSRELTTMLLLFTSAVAMYLSGRYMIAGITGLMKDGLTTPREQVFDVLYLHTAFVTAVLEALLALAPFLSVVVVIAVFAPLAVGGWVFDATAVQFKWERIDPVKGLKRVFGARGFIEMLKALAKFVLILGFAASLLYSRFDVVASLGLAGLERSLADASTSMMQVFFIAAAATILLALLDVPFQVWEHGKNLRMSRQELKDEMKESEGSPELRGRLRAQQQEIASRRMMAKVPEADVVITNPSHFAVALRFDPETMRAPRVVAKGADLVAQRIREIALEAGVTIMSAPPLARALYHSTKIDREVPPGLYVAVAQVLAYVFHLTRAAAGTVHRAPPRDLPIPDEFRY